MRLLSILSLALLGSSAFASHRISCQVEAEILAVNDLGRLNGSVKTFQDGSQDKEQTVRIKITKILKDDSFSGSCIKEGTKLTLHVKEDEQDDYKKGNNLTLDYQNMGDSVHNLTSWDVVGPSTPGFNPNAPQKQK